MKKQGLLSAMVVALALVLISSEASAASCPTQVGSLRCFGGNSVCGPTCKTEAEIIALGCAAGTLDCGTCTCTGTVNTPVYLNQGTPQSGNVSVTGGVTAGSATVSGNVSAGSLASTGNLSAVDAALSGILTVGSGLNSIVMSLGNLLLQPGKSIQINGAGEPWLNVGNWTNPGSLVFNVIGQINAQRIQITGGTPGVGKVLTSDASGNGTWRDLPTVTASGAAGGDLSGTYPNPAVAKIQGRDVAATAPADDQVLKWNNTSGKWEPGDVTAGAGDNLGNHTATQDLDLAGNNIANIDKLQGNGWLFVNSNQTVAGSEIGSTYYGASDHHFFTGGTEKFTVLNNGNVGINTTSPVRKLQIAGVGDTRIRVSASGPAGSSFTGYELWYNNNNSFKGGIFLPLDDPVNSPRVALFDGGGEVISLRGGQVGISNTNPDVKLEVGNGVSTAGNIIGIDGVSGYYSGLRLAAAGTEKWFSGYNDLNNFVIRRNNFSNDLTVDSTGKVSVNSFQVVSSGAAGKILTADANGNASWQSLASTTETDGIVGNEVTGATDGSLTLSGNGTNIPYTLALNPAYSNTWAADQKFNAAAFGGYLVDTTPNLFKVTTPSLYANQAAFGTDLAAGDGTVNAMELCIDGDCKNSWSGVTGPWTVSSNNIYSNNAGNVGVGVSSPSDKLQVGGNLRLDNGTAVGNGATPGNFFVRSRGQLYIVASDGETDPYFTELTLSTNAPTGKINFMVNSVNKMTINQSGSTFTDNVTMPGTGIWNSSGSVGIGTVTPGRKLSIYDATVGPIMSLSGLNTNYKGMSIRDSSSDAEKWFSGSNASNSFVIRRNGATDDLTVDSAGKVSVNNFQIVATTSAIGKVLTADVNGNASWQAPAIQTEIDGVIGNEIVSSTNSTLTRSGAGTAGNPYTLALNLGNSNAWTTVQTFGSGFITPWWDSTGDAQVKLDRDQSTSPGNNFFNVVNGGDTTVFQIDENGVIQTGIVPWAKLSNYPAACGAGKYVSAVSSSLTCVDLPVATTYSAGSGLSGLNLVGTVFSAQTSTALWNANKLRSHDISENAPLANQVLKYIGGVWTPAADDSGGDNLGDHRATTDLDMANKNIINVGSTISSTDSTALYVNSNETIQLRINTDNVGSNAGTFGINNSANSRIFTILNNGYVGIGTNAPSAKLSFGSNITAQKILVYESGNNRYGIGGDDNETKIFSASNGNITFGTISNSDGLTWSENMRIDQNGNVGIGTISPLSRLTVRKDTDTSNNSAIISDYGLLIHSGFANQEQQGIAFLGSVTVDAGTTPSAAIVAQRTGAWGIGDLVFKTKSGNAQTSPVLERMRILSNGNVGIGTTNPAYKLDVSGTLMVSGKTTLSNVSTTAAITVGGNIYANAFDIGIRDIYARDIWAGGNATIGGNLSIAGATNMTGDVTLANDLTIGGDATVSGTSSLARIDTDVRQARFEASWFGSTFTCTRVAGDSSITCGADDDGRLYEYVMDMACPNGYLPIAGGGWGFRNTNDASHALLESRPLLTGEATQVAVTPSNRIWRVKFDRDLAEIGNAGGSITCMPIQ